METFEIMFDDLNEEAQRAFLEFQGLESPSDGNYEIVPIVELEKEEKPTQFYGPGSTFVYSDESHPRAVIVKHSSYDGNKIVLLNPLENWLWNSGKAYSVKDPYCITDEEIVKILGKGWVYVDD